MSNKEQSKLEQKHAELMRDYRALMADYDAGWISHDQWDRESEHLCNHMDAIVNRMYA